MKKIILFCCSIIIYFISIGHKPLVVEVGFEPKEKLSEYNFFLGNIALQRPAQGLIPYSLNTPLFSDYAEKLRFLKIPTGTTVDYNDSEVLDFPEGTVIVKTFYFPNDFRDTNKGRKLMETRLLIHEPSGWKALEYVWNDDQTEAFLEVAGDHKQVNYIDKEGKKHTQNYVMPNLNQCKGCHNKNEVMTPIGPSVRQLNGNFDYSNGTDNQLVNLEKLGILKNKPALENCPKAPVWNQPETGNLNDRARIWLDINCGHCHRANGPASTSGLYLNIHEKDPRALGYNKPPVAAGRGSGNRNFDIVAGHPEQSILTYRINSTDPGVMMPEVGRKIIPKEGLALIEEWIKNMPVER